MSLSISISILDYYQQQLQHPSCTKFDTMTKQMGHCLLTCVHERIQHSPTIPFSHILIHACHDIVQNMFVPMSIQQSLLQLFCQIQRTYHHWKLWVRRVQFQFAMKQRRQNEHDLLGNILSSEKSTTYCLLQFGKIFLFSRRDIIQLWKASIGHSNHFHATPLPIKNPYNNTIFTTTELLNQYYFLKEGYYPIPSILEAYYQCHFCAIQLQKKYAYLLRDYAITTMYQHLTMDEKISWIEEMISEYNETRPFTQRIYIYEEYPKQQLIRDCQPHVETYFQSKFSLDIGKRRFRTEWIHAFRQFLRYNILFGRIVSRHINNQFRHQQTNHVNDGTFFHSLMDIQNTQMEEEVDQVREGLPSDATGMM
jgi:hypothetical protein